MQNGGRSLDQCYLMRGMSHCGPAKPTALAQCSAACCGRQRQGRLAVSIGDQLGDLFVPRSVTVEGMCIV